MALLRVSQDGAHRRRIQAAAAAAGAPAARTRPACTSRRSRFSSMHAPPREAAGGGPEASWLSRRPPRAHPRRAAEGRGRAARPPQRARQHRPGGREGGPGAMLRPVRSRSRGTCGPSGNARSSAAPCARRAGTSPRDSVPTKAASGNRSAPAPPSLHVQGRVGVRPHMRTAAIADTFTLSPRAMLPRPAAVEGRVSGPLRRSRVRATRRQ